MGIEMIVGYTVEGKPLTKKEYNERIAVAEKQLRYGEATSQDDLAQNMHWLWPIAYSMKRINLLQLTSASLFRHGSIRRSTSASLHCKSDSLHIDIAQCVNRGYPN